MKQGLRRGISILLVGMLAVFGFVSVPLMGNGSAAHAAMLDVGADIQVHATAGNTIGTATPISFATTYSGSITSTVDVQYYKITLAESGRVNIDSQLQIERIYLKLFDSEGKEIWYTYRSWDNTSRVISFNENMDLNSGTYYLCVAKAYGCTGPYNFKLSFTASGESFKEVFSGSDNTPGIANTISLGTTYMGQISHAYDDSDFYKFTLQNSGRVNIDSKLQIGRVYLKIFDSTGKEIWYTYRSWDDTSQMISFSENMDLNSGTYYFCVTKAYDHTGPYNLKLSFTASNESFKEIFLGSDNTLGSANTISLGTTYVGQISHAYDDADFYKFTLQSPGQINIDSKLQIGRVYLKIFDSTGKEIWYTYRSWDDTSQMIAFNENMDLSSGTYYFCVAKAYGHTGPYNFKLSLAAMVNFDAKGGTCSTAMKTVGVGSEVGSLPGASRTGYTFLGWYAADGAGVSSSTIVSGNTTCYARWKAKQYKIKFSPNGGKLSASQKSKTVTFGKKYGKLPTPKKKGYKFRGWYTDKYYGQKITAGKVMRIASTQKLYAHWQRKK